MIVGMGTLASSIKVPIFQSITTIIFGALFNEICHTFQRSMKLCLDCNVIQSE